MAEEVGRVGDVDGSVAVGVGRGEAAGGRAAQEQPAQRVHGVGQVDCPIVVAVAAAKLRAGLDDADNRDSPVIAFEAGQRAAGGDDQGKAGSVEVAADVEVAEIVGVS